VQLPIPPPLPPMLGRLGREPPGDLFQPVLELEQTLAG
jgi:hypothetical protein